MDLPYSLHYLTARNPNTVCVSVQVDELSPEAQKVIHSYTDGQPGQVGKYASLCAATGVLPWQPPTAQDYNTLLKACCSCPLCCVLLCAVSSFVQCHPLCSVLCAVSSSVQCHPLCSVLCAVSQCHPLCSVILCAVSSFVQCPLCSVILCAVSSSVQCPLCSVILCAVSSVVQCYRSRFSPCRSTLLTQVKIFLF